MTRGRCSRISGLGAKADLKPGRGVLYMEYNAVSVVMAEQRHKDWRLTRRAQSALFCYPSQPLLASPRYPLFPSAPSVSSCVLSVCRNRRPLHTRSLACSAACLLSLLFSFCRQRSATRVVSTLPLVWVLCLFSFLLRTCSTFRSGVTLCFLSREQRCEIYLHLFSFFSFTPRFWILVQKMFKLSFTSRCKPTVNCKMDALYFILSFLFHLSSFYNVCRKLTGIILHSEIIHLTKY